MLRFIIFALPFFAILTNVNYYQVKYIPPEWKPVLLYCLAMVPAFFLANLGINYLFNIGYRQIHNVWHLNIYFWIANFINIAVFSYIWFQELPSLKTFIAAILVIIAILLIV
ncbi:MAG: hypothetical protein GXZ07_00190 [Firmicutes bacterium]|nr:hypothetical protein [Bacillota bacterium]